MYFRSISLYVRTFLPCFHLKYFSSLIYNLNIFSSFSSHNNIAYFVYIPFNTHVLFSLQGFPFFGVQPTLLDENGAVIEGEGEGYLVFTKPWPGIMRTLFGDHSRYESVYFSKFKGYYCTGDGTLPCLLYL